MDERYAETLRKQEAKRKEIEKRKMKKRAQKPWENYRSKHEKLDNKKEHEENKEKSKNANIKTLVFLLVILFVIIAIVGTMAVFEDISTPVTDMKLSTKYAYLTQNATNFTISGTVNRGATVNITSEELNFNQTPIKVDANGKFEYVVKVPKKVGFGKLTISALAENKKPNSMIIEFKRTAPKTETPQTITESINNVDDGWITVNKLYPSIISESDELYYQGYWFQFSDEDDNTYVVPDTLYWDKFINYATKDTLKIKYHSGTGNANNGATFPIRIVDDVKAV